MKIKMNFGWMKTLIVVIVLLAAIAIIALDIVQLVGTETVKTGNPIVAGVSLAAAVIILIASLLILLNSYYRFNDEYLAIMLGFFCDKLMYDNVCAIRQNKDTKEIFVAYKNGAEEEEQTIRLNISAQKAEAFLAEMRRYCPFIIVEPFTPPEKKKKK